jgi:hypothetical protein
MKLWNRRNFLKAFTSLCSIPLISRGRSEKTTNHSDESSVLKSTVDLSLLLHCIAEVETGNDDSKVGKGGERSRYQISEVVWRQHGDEYIQKFPITSFREQCNGKDAYNCAMSHLLWLDRHILHITPIERDFRAFALAWCWKGGLSSWGKAFSIPLNNYAVRVTNLYDDPQFKLAFRARK